ncbi:MAG: pilus assembly protein PilM [Candidatus Nomurabacteria bacterium]|jgi:cell division protein FtsA|nr:pilus assembly protein PilM [Candidatus Nomurabacteria bacterium]
MKLQEKIKQVVGQKAARVANRMKNGELVLALDIGTEYIKALAATTAGKVDILAAAKVRQAAGNMNAGAIADIRGVLQATEKALLEIERQTGERAVKTVVGIAGELVRGETRRVVYRRPNADTRITEEEMSKIVRAVELRALQRAQKEMALETGTQVKLRLINSALVAVEIDGYKVNSPIDFQGSEVAVQIYTAFAPLVHIGAVEKIANELELDLISITTEPFAVYRAAIGDDESSNLTAIMLDIGGGTTDLAVVNEGGVEGTQSFAIGGRSFTREISQKLNLNLDEAERLKVSDVPADVAKVEEAVQDNLLVWRSGVELLLETFTGLDHLPSKILLSGGGAGLPAIKATLEDEAFGEDLPLIKHPAIQVLEFEALPGLRNRSAVELDPSFITAAGMLWIGRDSL